MTSPLRFWRRLRLGQKVMIGVLAAIIPLVVLGIQVSSMAGNLLSDQVRTNLGLASSIEAARMEQSMALAESTMDSIAQDKIVISSAAEAAEFSNLDAVTDRLQAYADLTGPRMEESGLVSMSFFLPGDTVPAASFGGGVSATSVLTFQTHAPDDPPRIEAFIADNEPRFTTIRWIGEGNPVTIVSEWSIPRMVIHQDLAGQLGFPIESMLLQGQADGTFVVLTSNNPSQIGTSRTLGVAAPVVGTPEVGDVMRNTASNREAVQAAARMKDQSGWVWLIEADADAVYSNLGTVRTAIVTVFLIAGFLILAVVAVSFRSLARRLGRMNRLADAIASGDLSVRTGDHGMDEIGRLSFAFDNMAQSLSEDIARRERVEAQLAHQATHDPLTGLPNRQHLIDELGILLAEESGEVSALFIDLDGFKEVNDRLGHDAGDELLTRVGDRLRDVLRPGDFVARLGGDEFVIVLKGLGLHEAERTASRVVSALELPFIVLDEEVGISASIGVSSSRDERSAESLLKQADIAMYQAKSMGKGRAVPVTDEALRQVDERLSLVSRLRAAVRADALDLLYSPIADLASGSLLGFEVKVRWHDPERGMIGPADFMALAERSGFATQIDEWVVRQSLAQLARWRDEERPVDDLFMSINLTAQSFVSMRTRTMLVTELTRNSIPPSRIGIEVPESVLAGDGGPLREAFKQYLSMGIPVTIDRFGSDYSNFDRLSRLAIDAVKIDLTLTSDLSSRASNHALVGSLISLARTSGMRVAAAGVDSVQIRDELLELGCTQGQGDWFSSEVDVVGFARLLSSRDLLGFMAN